MRIRYLLTFLLSVNIIAFPDDAQTPKRINKFFDYVESKDLSDKDAKKELEQYILEKCSALSFVWIGGTTNI